MIQVLGIRIEEENALKHWQSTVLCVWTLCWELPIHGGIFLATYWLLIYAQICYRGQVIHRRFSVTVCKTFDWWSKRTLNSFSSIAFVEILYYLLLITVTTRTCKAPETIMQELLTLNPCGFTSLFYLWTLFHQEGDRPDHALITENRFCAKKIRNLSFSRARTHN